MERAIPKITTAKVSETKKFRCRFNVSHSDIVGENSINSEIIYRTKCHATRKSTELIPNEFPIFRKMSGISLDVSYNNLAYESDKTSYFDTGKKVAGPAVEIWQLKIKVPPSLLYFSLILRIERLL